MLTHTKTWTEFIDLMISKRSQKPMNIFYMIPFTGSPRICEMNLYFKNKKKWHLGGSVS